MYVGGPGPSRFEILEAEMDGSSQRLLYQGEETIPACHLNIEKGEITMLQPDGSGALYSVNLLNGTKKEITHNITRNDVIPRALTADVAVLQGSGDVYALFFW